MPKNQIGKLFIVATPIGNLGDITLRAIETLKNADTIICEELRQGSLLLKRLGIEGKELLPANEHTERTCASEIILRLARGQNLALVSDCGTPVFSDPGHHTIEQVIAAGFEVIPVPGPSSLMAALSVLEFEPRQFIYAGYLPRRPEERQSSLAQLKSLQMTVIIMDTPYRLGSILADMAKVFGKNQPITLAADLTKPSEKIYRGSVAKVQELTAGKKAEFILIVHPPASSRVRLRK
ncbi:MAG: 16S rRNA (cytidine(1402)-2'-O)-methyltransferase [Anaerolineaceae bacterium]|nr:16S rRNA (cytidine(1402)-2'-O)-methyltransferase [Anaerolineaceae bacterium]